MNDNEPLGYVGISEWACEIDKHDLGLQSDNPLGAATVLLTDAGDLVGEIAAAAFREQALTPCTQQRLRNVITMLADVERLSSLCEDESQALLRRRPPRMARKRGSLRFANHRPIFPGVSSLRLAGHVAVEV